MKYPTLSELQNSRDMIDVFKGYNHNLRIGEGEFFDMTNLTSSSYPVLSPRKKRGIYASPDNPQGLIEKDSLCYVDGQYFVINENRIDMGLSEAEEDCPKQLISMGAYVIILPDKKYINTANLADFGNIEATVTTNAPVSFDLCRIDGSAYSDATASADEPANPTNLQLWIDTSSTPHTLKQYSESSSMWVSIATTYIKISSPGIGIPFEVGDGVTISGIESTQLSDLNSSQIVWDKGDDYIVVVGILDTVETQTSPITISRLMPLMDFVIESENRLWGCRYGVALNGTVVNEIYASKLGDFKNWNCFMGISTDSYAVTVGTDGQFTGAVKHLGYPLFFKENYMHKIYGNYPANYQVNTTTCRGVQKGSHKSLAIVNEVLYYKSRTAICAFDGSLPSEMSYALGDVVYSDAVAGSLGNKYYISMKDASGVYHLFAYDTSRGMWHREDNTRALDFCSCRGELYFIDTKDKKIKTVLGSGNPSGEKVNWMCETGIIGTDSPDYKYISKLNVRMMLDIDAKAYFSIEYDSSGTWEQLFTMSGTSLRSFTVPIRPQRCDHMRIRIEGIGNAKIFSITKTIEQGSDGR